MQEICNYWEIVYKHPRNISKKFPKDMSTRTKDIKQLSQQGSKPNNRLTDIQNIQNYLEIVYQHPRNISKKNQKNIFSRTGDKPLLA